MATPRKTKVLYEPETGQNIPMTRPLFKLIMDEIRQFIKQDLSQEDRVALFEKLAVKLLIDSGLSEGEFEAAIEGPGATLDGPDLTEDEDMDEDEDEEPAEEIFPVVDVGQLAFPKKETQDRPLESKHQHTATNRRRAVDVARRRKDALGIRTDVIEPYYKFNDTLAKESFAMSKKHYEEWQTMIVDHIQQRKDKLAGLRAKPAPAEEKVLEGTLLLFYNSIMKYHKECKEAIKAGRNPKAIGKIVLTQTKEEKEKEAEEKKKAAKATKK